MKKGDEKSGAFHEPLRELNVQLPVYTMPVVANGVLYIAASNRLYAIAHDPAR